MKRKLRLGLIGTGVAASRLYWPALKEASNVELVACANRTRRKAVAFARLAGVPVVADSAADLIASPDVDAVLLSLPIAGQPELVLQALAAGKPVLSEKPIGASVRSAKALMRSARRFTTPWLVGENFEFLSPVHQVAAWIRAGRLGDVRVVEARQMTLMNPKNPYFATAWRAKPEHLAGFISDGGVHLARVVRTCLGQPVVTKRQTAAFCPELPPFDTALALLEFPSGAVGTWVSCFAVPYSGPMLRVWGTKGEVELWVDRCVLTPRSGKRLEVKGRKNSFAAEFDHFADVVLRGAASRATPSAALADLELIDALCRRR
jgi:UDP-N-acetyl-2-amino-2-deoxyglucuronate dehydrogenase